MHSCMLHGGKGPSYFIIFSTFFWVVCTLSSLVCTYFASGAHFCAHLFSWSQLAHSLHFQPTYAPSLVAHLLSNSSSGACGTVSLFEAADFFSVFGEISVSKRSFIPCRIAHSHLLFLSRYLFLDPLDLGFAFVSNYPANKNGCVVGKSIWLNFAPKSQNTNFFFFLCKRYPCNATNPPYFHAARDPFSTSGFSALESSAPLSVASLSSFFLVVLCIFFMMYRTQGHTIQSVFLLLPQEVCDSYDESPAIGFYQMQTSYSAFYRT